jgi:catechol 2,3-dioxygenase-like lactoylglutathione lyase family enzyme
MIKAVAGLPQEQGRHPMADENRPYWRGLNHLALVTSDMDATVRFYHEVLDARLVATIGTNSFRHYFFDLGAGCTVAFFEYRGVEFERYAKPAGVPLRQAAQFDHVAFNVADEDALHRIRDRLKAAGCEVTDVVDHGFLRSIYFTDPNGIALEASYWVADPTARPSDYANIGLFADPDPVPAVRELRESGRVASVPTTRLTAEATQDYYRAEPG